MVHSQACLLSNFWVPVGTVPVEMMSMPRELGLQRQGLCTERVKCPGPRLLRVWMVGPRACSPQTGKDISEAAFQMPLKAGKGVAGHRSGA